MAEVTMKVAIRVRPMNRREKVKICSKSLESLEISY